MKVFAFFVSLSLLAACAEKGAVGSNTPTQKAKAKTVSSVNLSPSGEQATAAFAEGCFWCVEEVFEAVVGVDSAVSGYAGGHVDNPSYELVNTETTGHAETVLVYYQPDKVTYEELCRVFYYSHDPTTPDRQGPDRGSSYRSILFYQTDAEKAIAEKVTAEFEPRFSDPIVTEIKALDKYWRAEEYHQDYIVHHPENPYVQNVSIPRFERFKKVYDGELKEK